MSQPQNSDVRIKAKKCGVCLWEIADRLGISEATMVRKMRKELPDNERNVILVAIEELAKEKEG